MSELKRHVLSGWRHLSAHPARSLASAFSLSLGVAGVIVMLAVSQGAKTSSHSQVAALGSNLLMLKPGSVRINGVAQEAGTFTRLSLSDMRAIEDQVPTVNGIAPNVSGRLQVAYFNRNWNTDIVGSTPSYARLWAAVPESGRFFTDDEVASRERVAVIGQTVKRELFGDGDPLGETIKINRIFFRVIGVLPVKGANSSQDQDDMVLIPLSTAMYRVLGKQFVDAMDIEISDVARMEKSKEEILDVLYSRKRLALSQADEAFQLRNMAEVQEAFTQTNKNADRLLSAAAVVALIMGGIGLMNMMMISARERKDEIARLCTEGFERKQIVLTFLTEATLAGFLSGVAGVVVGGLISLCLSLAFGWATAASIANAFVMLLVASLLGLVFGLAPALRAAGLVWKRG